MTNDDEIVIRTKDFKQGDIIIFGDAATFEIVTGGGGN